MSTRPLAAFLGCIFVALIVLASLFVISEIYETGYTEGFRSRAAEVSVLTTRVDTSTAEITNLRSQIDTITAELNGHKQR